MTSPRAKKSKPRNAFERRIYRGLRRAKVSFKYESEKIPYILARHYSPDFVVTTPRGKVYIECKGYLDRDAKAKMVAVKRLHPTLDIRILFYSRKPKDIRWAEKHGFPWAVDKIPKEWIQ